MLDGIHDVFIGGTDYLNTSNYGLFPKQSVEDIHQATLGLADGTFDTETRNAAVEASRTCFASMIAVSDERVATGCSVSPFVGVFASSLPDGATVLVAEDDFTSLTKPFVVQADRLDIRSVPLESFLGALDDSVDVAAVSAVQSADGAVTDLKALAELRNATGAKVLLDITQAASWLPVQAGDFDVVVAAAYKWLLSPRGVAFAYFSEEMTEQTKPILAGWYAAEDIHTGYYGTDMELAGSARRFDISPTGINWIGTAPALDLLLRSGVESINRHNVGLANRFRAALGMPESNSAIVSLQVDDRVTKRLRAEQVQFGLLDGKRAGYARFSFHLYNTDDDVKHALSCFT